MPRFAANLSMLFTEVPFLERFERAANAGFEAVEFLFPYAHTIEEIQERLTATGLQIVLHNLPAGDWDAGERGIACDRQGFGGRVEGNMHFQLGLIAIEAGVAQRLKAQFVASV